MRDNNHDSIKSILNATMLVKNPDAPETLRKMFRRDLEQDKKLFQEILQLDEDADYNPKNGDLRLYFKSVEEVLDEFLSNKGEDL